MHSLQPGRTLHQIISKHVTTLRRREVQPVRSVGLSSGVILCCGGREQCDQRCWPLRDKTSLIYLIKTRYNGISRTLTSYSEGSRGV